MEELPASVEYWGDQGVNTLSCGYLSLANGMPHEQSLYYHQELMLKVFDEARKVAQRYPGLELQLPKPVAEELNRKQATPCLAPWRFVMIDASGGILPCYRSFEAMVMGNLYEDEEPDFRAIWNSADYQALRRTVNRDSGERFFNYCSACEMRWGWGREESHLGDETWLKMLEGRTDKESLTQIDHRRLKAK